MLGRDSFLWGRPSDPKDAPRRSILHCVRMLAPFQEALPESPYLTSDVAEGERQFYAFLRGLYDDMYGDPGFFLVPETEYDAYMTSPARREWEEKNRGELAQEGRASVDQKESRLRNRFQQAIRFYAAYLYELGMRGKVQSEGVLELTLASWREARAAMEWPHLREGNEERFQRLRALGLEVTQGKGGILIVNRDFPKMMFGLWVLCSAPKTPYHRMNYLRLDFAAALRGTPRMEDVFRSLTPERAGVAKEFHLYGEKLGLKGRIKPLREITSGSLWKVEYQQGSKAAAVMYAGPEGLILGVHLGSGERMERLKKALPRLQEWIAEKLRRRGGESARPGDWEEEERTSAVSVFRLDLPDPGPGDLARLKALLKASVSLEEG